MPNETPAIPSPLPSAPGIFARLRAWFAAALATVKAAAAPQVQQGPDLVDTVPAAPGKFRLWLSAAWAAVKRGRAVVVLLVIGALSLMAVQFLWPDAPPANPSAAVQTSPLAPLIARIAALEALDAQVAELQGQVAELQGQVAELQDQVDGLQRRQQPQASASGRIATQRPASSQSTQPSTGPERRRWGTTDLDREIDAFTQSLDTPTPLEPTK